MFDWEDLRHFTAFAEGGTLSAAARLLKVDHATVARRLISLEQALGLRLLDRRGRRFRLTAIGERIAAQAQGMSEAALAIARTAAGADGTMNGTVSVSAPPVLTETILLPALGPFHQAYPGISLNMIGETRHATLKRREADLALRLSRPREEGVVARRIGELAFGLYGARDYLARHLPADYRFIACDDSLDQAAQQRWLFAVAAGRPVVLRATLLTAQKAAVRAGIGLAALPHFLAADDDALVRLTDVTPAEVRRDIWLMVHEDLRHSPVIRAVIDALTATVQAKGALLGTMRA